MYTSEFEKLGKCRSVFFLTRQEDNSDDCALHLSRKHKAPEHSIVLTTDKAEHDGQLLRNRLMWFEQLMPDQMYKELLAEQGENGIIIRKLSDIKESNGM